MYCIEKLSVKIQEIYLEVMSFDHQSIHYPEGWMFNLGVRKAVSGHEARKNEKKKTLQGLCLAN